MASYWRWWDNCHWVEFLGCKIQGMHTRILTSLFKVLLLALAINASIIQADAAANSQEVSESSAPAVYEALADNIELLGRWYADPV